MVKSHLRRRCKKEHHQSGGQREAAKSEEDSRTSEWEGPHFPVTFLTHLYSLLHLLPRYSPKFKITQIMNNLSLWTPQMSSLPSLEVCAAEKTRMILFRPPNSPVRLTLSSPLYWRGKLRLGRLSKVFKVTQLISIRIGSYFQVRLEAQLQF